MDAGLVQLVAMKHLEDIVLDGTAVPDAGLAHLSRCSNAVSLSLS